MVWVLFDYGQVIGEPQAVGTLAGMARRVGADPAAFEAAYWLHRDAYDGAELSHRDYWSTVSESRGAPLGDDLVDELDRLDIESWLHQSAGTVDIVRDLQKAGVSLALLSNAPETTAAQIALQDWTPPFGEHLYFSSHLRLIKPSPEVFRHVLERLGADPADVVFVDDRAVNVEAAAALGMRTILFRDAADLRRQLESAGVL
ncbi:MAG: family hydrolase [Frankiales bacterium]|nr:family hydrolase [Frankiales bacterium]